MHHKNQKSTVPSPVVWVFLGGVCRFEARPPLPRPRGGLARAALSDALVALGGRRTNGEKMDAVERGWEGLVRKRRGAVMDSRIVDG